MSDVKHGKSQLYREALEGKKGLSKFLDMVVECENEVSYESDDIVGQKIHDKIKQISDRSS